VIDENQSDAEPKKPKSVVACLTLGFDIAARNPHLSLLPFLLDLYLWLGPRLSLEPILREFQTVWNAMALPEDVGVTYQLFNQMLEEVAQTYNLFSFMETFPMLGVPTLMGQRLTVARPFGARPAIPVNNVPLAFGWVCVIIILGLGLSALYLWRIGLMSGEAADKPIPGPMQPGRIWGNLLKLTLWFLAALVALGIPALFVASLVSFISIGFSGFILTVFLSVGVFALLHAMYTIPSIVQFRKYPLQALRESFVLTRADFPGTLGLLLVSLVISQGLNFIWTLPDPGSWATLVGIGGHALISTALMTTLFIFYQERIAYLKMLQKIYATSTKQSAADTG
jgi:hypothetical protein